MNDPGLDEPISNEAEDVENRQRSEKEEREEDASAFMEPDRWWIAGTAFPLVAGTFGPMASAFSICSLVVHWRDYIPPGGTEDQGVPVSDPAWLITINAIQLAIALIANAFLLLNMTRRVRFSIAQPITIVGWYLSSFALIALTACASGPLVIEPSSSYAFSMAFYYAVWAAGLYFVVASLMVVTVYGAYQGHYDKEFQLTMSQRTLMLQTISLLVYLLLGALLFSHVEGWEYLDAVYWANVTILTVGLGDYTPSTHLGRSLLFPYAIGGIIILGLVIGSIRSLVLERGKVKMGARMIEKQRRFVLKQIERSNKSQFLEPIQPDSNTNDGADSRVSTPKLPTNGTSGITERQRRKLEFQLMRKIQERAQVRRRWTSLAISGIVWFFLWLAGAAIFEAAEKDQEWSYFVALYFSYTALLTIGYGDFTPKSNSGKAFFVFWSLLAIPSLTILISNMGDTVVKGVRDLTLWLGNFTVLPGEQGITATLKSSAHKITNGKIFNSNIHTTPPGILGESRQHGEDSDNDSNDGHEPKNDPESAAQQHAGADAKVETAKAKKQGEGDDQLPKSRHHYHYILIKEIAKVQKHLRSSPPRKYTFDEWAWYLKLVGEDESNPDSHRKASRKPRTGGEGLGNAMQSGHGDGEGRGLAGGRDGGDGPTKWSWVGHRSPLMGSKEESEWVLERLTQTLDRELEQLRREELEGEGRRSEGEREKEGDWGDDKGDGIDDVEEGEDKNEDMTTERMDIAPAEGQSSSTNIGAEKKVDGLK